MGTFRDVTEKAGVGIRVLTMGAVGGGTTKQRPGWPDLLITCLGGSSACTANQGMGDVTELWTKTGWGSSKTIRSSCTGAAKAHSEGITMGERGVVDLFRFRITWTFHLDGPAGNLFIEQGSGTVITGVGGCSAVPRSVEGGGGTCCFTKQKRRTGGGSVPGEVSTEKREWTNPHGYIGWVRYGRNFDG